MTVTLDIFREARDFGRQWALDRHRESPTYGGFLVDHVHYGAALPMLGLTEPTRESELLSHFICRAARREWLRLKERAVVERWFA